MKNELILRLEFGESSSKQYTKAVSRLKNFPTYGMIDQGAETNYIELTGPDIFGNYRRLENLWKIVSGWRSASLLVNGEATTFARLHSYQTVAKCMAERESSSFQDAFCTEDNALTNWGCKLLDSVKLYPDTSFTTTYVSRCWYRYGEFDESGKWVVSKDKIKSTLLSEVDRMHINHCSFFNVKRIDEKLATFPDIIDPVESDDWVVIERDVFVGSEIQKKPNHIAPKALADQEEHLNSIRDRIRASSTYGGIRIGFDETEQLNNNHASTRNIPDVSFDEIGGIDDIIEKIREVIELPLKQPELLSHLHIQPHKGVLMFGPPGCGKTLIAKAIANEIEAHFISVKGPELISKYHGESEENLRSLYQEAQQLQPSIIYFDEIDSVAQVRSDSDIGRIDAKFVNQLLTLMDGIENSDGVCIIASTNRPELLDPALLRPGRFDYKLEVPLPDTDGRLKIFDISIKGMPIDEVIDKKKLVTTMRGLSGADIAYIAREGAYNALRRSRNLADLVKGDPISPSDTQIIITQEDFELAIKGLIEGENGK